MTLAVGIFDLFTYLIPGSLYLTLFTYAATRLDWIDPAALTRTPLLLLLIAAALLSYLLGYLAYPIGQAANRLLPTAAPAVPARSSSAATPPPTAASSSKPTCSCWSPPSSHTTKTSPSPSTACAPPA